MASGKVELFIMPFSLGERDFPPPHPHTWDFPGPSFFVICVVHGIVTVFPRHFFSAVKSPQFSVMVVIIFFLLLSVGARVKGQQFYFANIVCSCIKSVSFCKYQMKVEKGYGCPWWQSFEEPFSSFGAQICGSLELKFGLLMFLREGNLPFKASFIIWSI